MAILRQHAIKHYGGKLADMPATLPYGDTYLTTDGRFFKYNQDGLPQEITTGSLSFVEDEIRTNIQGYYGLLSGIYFDGVATASEIAIEQVDVWQDVIMTIDPQGLADQRVKDMKEAQSIGHTGDGSLGNPITFLLEGLRESSTANLRASLGFNPDEDEGKLDARIYVERHSGATPSSDFTLDAAPLIMASGAEIDYSHYVNIQFFIGDTIDTYGPGDAGKIRFQIKSDVAGTVSMNEMALFVQL